MKLDNLVEILAVWGSMMFEPHALSDYESDEEFITRYGRMYEV